MHIQLRRQPTLSLANGLESSCWDPTFHDKVHEPTDLETEEIRRSQVRTHPNMNLMCAFTIHER